MFSDCSKKRDDKARELRLFDEMSVRVRLFVFTGNERTNAGGFRNAFLRMSDGKVG